MTIPESVRCDECGAQATTAVRDFVEVTAERDAWRCYESVGGIRAGCDAHPVESRVIE